MTVDELASRGFDVETKLAMGDPATELIRVAEEQGVDLIAMSTHGHRYLSDLIHGTTADGDGIFTDVKIEHRFASGVPLVRLDVEQIRRVIINLVDNAVKL